MKKRRFIGYIRGEYGIIRGDEFHHLVNVNRAYKGKEFILITKDGRSYSAVIEKINRKKKEVLARLYKLLENKDTPEWGVYIAFALFSENRLRFLLEKCTEIGVKGFLPFISERSKRKEVDIKSGWIKVIESAVKQSERGSFPVLYDVMKLDEVLEKAKELGNVYLLDRQGIKLDDINLEKKNCVVFVGPEGGFTEKEKKMIKEKGSGVVSLGDNVFRTETAAIISSYEFLSKIKSKGGEAFVRSPSA